MTLSLGSIADDYTGASDLANTLTRCGLRTIQTIGVPAADLALPEVDAVVVALKSRSIAARQAVELARAADDWLRARGASHVMFKICSTFDSTDAGNIGPVTDALRAAAGSKIVLVTPAFPATARTVYQGNLFVGSVPLNESPLKDHPLNPMRDANLVRVLARQSRCRIGLVDLAVVAAGADAVGKCLAALAGDGIEAAIVDAVFERDLETIGTVALEDRVSVGASGSAWRGRWCKRAARTLRAPLRWNITTLTAWRRAWPEAARGRRSHKSRMRNEPCRCCDSIPRKSSPDRRRRTTRSPGLSTGSAAARC